MRVGGAIAIAFAFARLAAMAAARLDFLGTSEVALLEPEPNTTCTCGAVGSGHTFSMFFRFEGSREARMIAARAGQMALNDQNACREASRAAGLVSASPFLTRLSSASTCPALSNDDFARVPLMSINCFICIAMKARVCTFFSARYRVRRGMTVRARGDRHSMKTSTAV